MPDQPDPVLDAELEGLLAFLHESHGVDFTGYKRPSLRRLIARRLSAVGETDVRAYVDRLEVDPDEVRALFDALLINVTGFFRDAAAWEALREPLLPQLLDTLGPDEPIRVWSAACATGEEAYSLAILLHQLLGTDEFRRRVKVYATDVDEPALAVARTGRYPRSAVADLPLDVVADYFTDEGDTVSFRGDLRPHVIFGRHDLLADAPISRVAVLSCRNALMYFTAETQARVLERFAFALHESGLLLLGKAEMLLTHADLFTPVSLHNRIFRARGRTSGLRFPGARLTPQARDLAARRIAEAAFTTSHDAQVVLDRDQQVILVNDAAADRLEVRRQDVGRPFEQLELSYRPVELRSVVERVLDTGQVAELRDVRWSRRDAADSWWDVQVAPLNADPDGPIGAQVTFLDVTRYHALTGELTRAHAELQEAYEELQSSSEELETTNEELQSAIEELETTNEELQSTNEELETMNEELQSTNEELQTVNDELRERTGEVREVNALLEGVLSSLASGIAVVDRDLRVLLWNPAAERLWGLRAFEVEGSHLLLLPGGLPVDDLRSLVQPVLDSGSPGLRRHVALMNRFGEPVRCTLSAGPLSDSAGVLRGIVIGMTQRPDGEAEE